MSSFLKNFSLTPEIRLPGTHSQSHILRHLRQTAHTSKFEFSHSVIKLSTKPPNSREHIKSSASKTFRSLSKYTEWAPKNTTPMIIRSALFRHSAGAMAVCMGARTVCAWMVPKLWCCRELHTSFIVFAMWQIKEGTKYDPSGPPMRPCQRQTRS